MGDPAGLSPDLALSRPDAGIYTASGALPGGEAVWGEIGPQGDRPEAVPLDVKTMMPETLGPRKGSFVLGDWRGKPDVVGGEEVYTGGHDKRGRAPHQQNAYRQAAHNHARGAQGV